MNNHLEILKKKKDLMLEFANLTGIQQEVITKEDYEQLFTVLKQKDNIIKDINILETELEKHNLPQDEIAKLLLQEIKELVDKTIKLDDKNIADLKTSRDLVAQKVKQAHKNKQTHFEYQGRNKSIEGILIDKKK